MRWPAAAPLEVNVGARARCGVSMVKELGGRLAGCSGSACAGLHLQR
jgi:hypothetical protein